MLRGLTIGAGEEAAKRTILEMNENDMELITFLNYDTKKIKSYLIELLKKRDQWIDVVKDYKASSCKEIEKKTYDYYQNEVKEYVDSFSEAFSIDEIKDIENILIYIHNASPKIQFLYKPDDINFRVGNMGFDIMKTVTRNLDIVQLAIVDISKTGINPINLAIHGPKRIITDIKARNRMPSPIGF